MEKSTRYIMAPSYLWDGTADEAETGVCLLIEDGKVICKETLGQCRRQAPDAEVYAGDYLILPGFTDAHDHGRGVSPTGYGVADRPLELWL